MAKKPTLANFAEICQNKAANKTEIAKAFGVSRRSLYNWMENPKYKEAYDDVEESLLDFTESQKLILMKGIPKITEDENGNKKQVGWIEKPSETLIMFTLNNKGKERGYGNKVDITSDGEKIENAPIMFLSADSMTPEEIEKYKAKFLSGNADSNDEGS